MKKVLEKIKNNYKLHNEDSAFEVLSGVIIFKKSVESIISDVWIRKESDHGTTFSNSEQDGKIDLINIDVDYINRKLNIGFVQVKNSKRFGDDDINNFVQSVYKHFINDEEIIDNNYMALKPKQTEFRKLSEKYRGYSKNYLLCLSYTGSRDLPKLKQYVENFGLPNVSYNVFNISKLTEGLKDIKNISSNPVDINYTVKSTQPIIVVDNEKFCSCTLLVDSKEIKNLIEYEQEKNIELNRLFNNNVRGFLETSSINNQIKDTIISYSDSFYYCNNGATIFCDEILKQGGSDILVKNPRIINGQQSIASIFKYDKNNNTEILVKFVSVRDNEHRDEMMNMLCMTTNTSNEIKPINLISNSRLVIETKQLFKENGIGLSIKEGALLNNVFVDDFDIDLEDLLKIWATIYMNRPDLAKAKGRVVKSFYKAELDEPKYKILKNEKVVNKIKEQFFIAYKFFIKIKDVMERLKKEEFYSHGYYLIMYMIYMEYGIDPDISKIDISFISNKINKMIIAYKEETEAAGNTYSLNNYFKGTRPLVDLKVVKKSELEFIKEISEELKLDENNS